MIMYTYDVRVSVLICDSCPNEFEVNVRYASDAISLLNLFEVVGLRNFQIR